MEDVAEAPFSGIKPITCIFSRISIVKEKNILNLENANLDLNNKFGRYAMQGVHITHHPFLVQYLQMYLQGNSTLYTLNIIWSLH